MTCLCRLRCLVSHAIQGWSCSNKNVAFLDSPSSCIKWRGEQITWLHSRKRVYSTSVLDATLHHYTSIFKDHVYTKTISILDIPSLVSVAVAIQATTGLPFLPWNGFNIYQYSTAWRSSLKKPNYSFRGHLVYFVPLFYNLNEEVYQKMQRLVWCGCSRKPDKADSQLWICMGKCLRPAVLLCSHLLPRGSCWWLRQMYSCRPSQLHPKQLPDWTVVYLLGRKNRTTILRERNPWVQTRLFEVHHLEQIFTTVLYRFDTLNFDTNSHKTVNINQITA